MNICTDVDKEKDYFYYLLESLQIGLNIISFSYEKIYPACCEITNAGDNISAKYSEALSYAWSFIDNYRLVLKILEQLPNEMKNAKDIEELKEKAKPIIEARNYHFHIEADNKYEKFCNGFPFGNLSWMNPDNKNMHYIGMPLLCGRKVSYNGLVFDTIKTEYISKTSLSIGNITIQFDLLCKYLKEYIDCINKTSIDNDSFKLRINVFCLEFSFDS